MILKLGSVVTSVFIRAIGEEFAPRVHPVTRMNAERGCRLEKGIQTLLRKIEWTYEVKQIGIVDPFGGGGHQ